MAAGAAPLEEGQCCSWDPAATRLASPRVTARRHSRCPLACPGTGSGAPEGGVAAGVASAHQGTDQRRPERLLPAHPIGQGPRPRSPWDRDAFLSFAPCPVFPESATTMGIGALKAKAQIQVEKPREHH